MTEHDTLWQPRRTTTVRERYQVFPPGFAACGRCRWMGAQQLAKGQCRGAIHRALHREHILVGTNSNNVFQCGRLSAYRLHQWQQLMLNHDCCRIAIAYLVGDFALFIRGVHRAGNCANARDSEPANHIFSPVGHEQAHRLTLAYAQVK